jgi:AraC-like DNA-binding protein
MDNLYNISPYIREVRIWSISPLFGEWQDFDNVLTYIQSGEAEYIFNGQRYFLQAGDIIIMHPFCTHIVKSNATIPFLQYILHFDMEYTGNNLPRNEVLERGVNNCYDKANLPKIEMYFREKPFIARLGAKERKIVEERFLIMLHEYTYKKTGYELMLKSIALKLISIFIRSSDMELVEKTPVSKSLKKIEQAVSYIHVNYSNPDLNNLMVSEFSETTPNYLASIFKKYLNMSVHQYINHVRIEKAKWLITSDSFNFTEIADKIGYNSIHIFSRVFKSVAGKTPSEYLSQNLAKFDDI